MSLVSRSLILWGLIIAGCSSEPLAVDPLVVEVGGANFVGDGFVSWATPGSDAAVITGFQGGQHIWVSVRSKLSNAEIFDTSVAMYREATGSDAEAYVKPGPIEIMRKTQLVDGWQVVAGIPAFVKEPCKVRAHRLRVEAVVRSGDGRIATGKAWIVPHYDGYCDP